MGFSDFAKKEKNIQRGNVSDSSLSIDQLSEELINIGITDGFISNNPGGKFNNEMRNFRAIEIGEIIHRRGKLDLMVKVYKKVAGRVGEERSSGLRFAWQGIGGQWDPYYVTTLL
jgi:hypothetical protein